MASPTIVLVHGAFGDASAWHPVFDALGRAGYDGEIRAPANPLRGLAVDARHIASVVEEVDGPIVLVGHSYGGAVITVAGGSEKVSGLVFVAGFAPQEGESLGQLQAGFPAVPIAENLRPMATEDGPEVIIDRTAFHDVFAADLAPEETAFLAIAQRPVAVAAFEEPASYAAWTEKPSWAVLPGADRAINPDLHRFDYERAGSTVTEIEGASHAVMLSQPERVAAVIREAAMS